MAVFLKQAAFPGEDDVFAAWLLIAVMDNHKFHLLACCGTAREANRGSWYLALTSAGCGMTDGEALVEYLAVRSVNNLRHLLRNAYATPDAVVNESGVRHLLRFKKISTVNYDRIPQ